MATSAGQQRPHDIGTGIERQRRAEDELGGGHFDRQGPAASVSADSYEGASQQASASESDEIADIAEGVSQLGGGGSDALPERQARGRELRDLLQKVNGLTLQHGRHGDHRSADHLALAPQALQALQRTLSLLDSKDDAEQLCHSCTDALLIATDDCGKEADSRGTLTLAKSLVVDMLRHKQLSEAMTNGVRERFERWVVDLDGWLKRLNRTRPAQHSTGRNEPVVESSAKEPASQERRDVNGYLEKLYISMLPSVEQMERVENVRQILEWALRQKWHDARVQVFGSAAAQLATGASDIDLTLCLSQREKYVYELKQRLDSYRDQRYLMEERHADAVQQMTEGEALENNLRRQMGEMKSLRQDEQAIARALREKEKRVTKAQKQVVDLEALLAVAEATAATPSQSEDCPPEPDKAQANPAGSASANTAAAPATPAPAHTPSTVAAQANGVASSTPDAATRTGANGIRNLGDVTSDPVAPPASLPASAGPSTAELRWRVAIAKSDMSKFEDTRQLSENRLKKTTVKLTKGKRELAKAEEAYSSWSRASQLASPKEKAAQKAVLDARKAVMTATGQLEKTKKIVFEIKRVVERQDFTHVMAVARARVPVVKMVAPPRFWGPSGRKCSVDISVNNLVALHNTRLLRHYTDIDPRCRKVLYLVKAWAKARGINNSAGGTLSSYGHCVGALHYLIRAGIVPSLLKEHGTKDAGKRNADGDGTHPQPADVVLVEGIDVFFHEVSLPADRAVPPQGRRRNVRQRTDGSNDGVSAENFTGAAAASSLGTVGVECGVENPGKGEERDGQEKFNFCRAGDSLTVFDLLAGYFRYWAEEFQHGSEVATLRPKAILNKHDVWDKPKMWRTSIEDPFMTHDSPFPHDLGWVLTRGGQDLLHTEWQRGHELMRTDGADAVAELFLPCQKVRDAELHQQRLDRHHRADDGGRGRRGGRRRDGDRGPRAQPGGAGGRTAPPSRQIWDPHQGGRGPPPPPRQYAVPSHHPRFVQNGAVLPSTGPSAGRCGPSMMPLMNIPGAQGAQGAGRGTYGNAPPQHGAPNILPGNARMLPNVAGGAQPGYQAAQSHVAMQGGAPLPAPAVRGRGGRGRGGGRGKERFRNGRGGYRGRGRGRGGRGIGRGDGGVAGR